MDTLAEESLPREEERMTGNRPRWFWIGLGTVLLVGLVLRVAGSTGELWVDELCSLALVTPLKSASQIFIGIHYETNHYLTSLWMWICGAEKDWWVYRVPSILAGMGAALAAVRIGLRRSRATAFVAGLLMSLSYLAVFYSSEARGYAVACCMTLVGYDCMELYLRDRTWQNAAGYGLAVVLGMLGNLSYVSVAVALGLWSIMVLLWQERTWRSAGQFVALHAAPVALLGALWLVDIRKLVPGAAPQIGIWPVLCETISYAFGLPGNLRLAGVLVVGVFAFIVWQIARMAREGDMRWIFFATGLVMAPAALLGWTGRAYIFPRYFLVNVYLLYLLAALEIGIAWGTRRVRTRWLIGSLLAAWTLGNLLLSVQLWQVGRGHYKDALEYISANTPGGRAQVGSMQDFRSEILVGYYAKYLPVAQRPELLDASSVGQLRPEWLLSTISPDERSKLPQAIVMAPGLWYVLVKQYPSTQLSGFAAGVYRRADLVGTPAR
jgi:hypothetical protein